MPVKLWMLFRTALPAAGCGVLLLLGALFWASGRDPFERVWFTVKVANHARTQCVVVLPKTTPRPYPVVVYLHGSGGGIHRDGNDLRQIAEMGLAAVSLDYCQTNDAVCEQQFAALMRHLPRRKWADTNAVAWVGFSLGAEKATRFALQHPGVRPRLLVRLGGGWLPEFEAGENHTPNVEPQPSRDLDLEGKQEAARLQDVGEGTVRPALSRDAAAEQGNGLSVLLLHGAQDNVFPVADTKRVAAALRVKGMSVQTQVLAGLGHGFQPARGSVFRAVGEHCLTRLRGPDTLREYQSIGTWREGAWPLWLCGMPALIWVAAWAVWRWLFGVRAATRCCRATASRERAPRGSRFCRWLAAGLALLGAGTTAMHLGIPQLAVSVRTLEVARRFLVRPAERADFEFMAAQPCWREQRLATLLEHVRLAHYNRHLVNWQVEDAAYREFVLSPAIADGPDDSLRWRRVLWESLYPRVRREQSVEAAAETVVRHLRERVTPGPDTTFPRDVRVVWQRQLASVIGLQRLLVAGLRAVGIPARLNPQGQAEFLVAGDWKRTPDPVAAPW